MFAIRFDIWVAALLICGIIPFFLLLYREGLDRPGQGELSPVKFRHCNICGFTFSEKEVSKSSETVRFCPKCGSVL